MPAWLTRARLERRMRGPAARLVMRIVAVLYAYGAIVHVANMFGARGMPWVDTPLPWRLLDAFYLVLDLVVFLGLWRLKWWGIAAFVLAAVTQLLLYLGFPWLVTDAQSLQRELVGLVTFHIVSLAAVALVLALRK